MPWLLVAAAAAAAFYYFSESSGGKSPQINPPKDQLAGIDACLVSIPDPAMRAKIKAVVVAALAGSGDPTAIDAAANDVQAQGFPSAAACLRAAAVELRKKNQGNAPIKILNH